MPDLPHPGAAVRPAVRHELEQLKSNGERSLNKVPHGLERRTP